MPSYTLSHLSDQALSHELAVAAGGERTATATLLAHLAEFDERRLYLPAGYPSMVDYCVHHLHWCEQAALKRIRAARYARSFPALFRAVAEGRLHLTAVILLGPHMTPGNAEELLAAAAHRTRAEIERLLAERYPRPDLPTMVQALSPSLPGTSEVSPGTPPTTNGHAPGEAAPPRPKVAALSPQRFGLQLTMSQETHDKLRYAQALLSHHVPSGDVAQVLDRALDALIRQLERIRFAATRGPAGRARTRVAEAFRPT